MTMHTIKPLLFHEPKRGHFTVPAGTVGDLFETEAIRKKLADLKRRYRQTWVCMRLEGRLRYVRAAFVRPAPKGPEYVELGDLR